MHHALIKGQALSLKSSCRAAREAGSGYEQDSDGHQSFWMPSALGKSLLSPITHLVTVLLVRYSSHV